MRRGSSGLLPSTCWELSCLAPLALFPLSADRHSGALGTADTLCSKVSQSNPRFFRGNFVRRRDHVSWIKTAEGFYRDGSFVREGEGARVTSEKARWTVGNCAGLPPSTELRAHQFD